MKFLVLVFSILLVQLSIAGITVVDNGPSTKEVDNKIGVFQGLDANGDRVNISSSADSTIVQATPGADATKAVAVQGVTGGKPVETEEPTLDSIYNRLNDVYSRLGPVYSAQSGTWTVQPGNTANTTAWKVELVPSSTGPINSTKTVPQVTAEQIVASSTPATRGVLVSADLENIATVYVGGSSLTTGNGVGLRPGDSRFYEVNNANLIYCISTSASQILRIEVL